MKKMRISELAKDLSLEAKDLLRIAKDLAISVENTMSILDVHDIERIRKRIEKDTQKTEEQDLQDVYEEQRVSTNIIRRRAKPAPAPEAPAPEEAPAKIEIQAVEVTEQDKGEKKPPKKKEPPIEAAKEALSPKGEGKTKETPAAPVLEEARLEPAKGYLPSPRGDRQTPGD